MEEYTEGQVMIFYDGIKIGNDLKHLEFMVNY